MKGAAKKRTCGSSHPRKWFHEDAFGQLRADAYPHITNLANDICLLTQELDLLLFAKTHFAQAMGHLTRSRKLLDPHSRSGAHLAQGANEWLAALRFHSSRLAHRGRAYGIWDG